MSNDIQEFVFPITSQVIRIVDRDGNPWFVRNDVCAALGHKNPSQATATHCKPEGVSSVETLTQGGIQNIVIINEGNFNRLIMRSNVEHAAEFQDWVCDVILPSIRKTGSYSLKPAASNDSLIQKIEIMLELAKEQARQAEEQARQEAVLAQINQKVEQIERDRGGSGYVAILGFCRKHDIEAPISKARKWGMKAAHLARLKDVTIGKASHEIYGEVNTYPELWLIDNYDAIFEE